MTKGRRHHVPPRTRGTVAARARNSYAVRRLVLPVQEFVHTETASAIVLLACAVAAVLWVNSPWGSSYENLFSREISLHFGGFAIAHSLREWINDALMAGFFFVVGLEVKREFVHGELSEWRRASLPVLCALGGMICPALIYLAFNYGGPGARGWGIPMATDIAFALGALALAGNHIPASLRVFLLALATVDDIGAVLVIAFFYTDTTSLLALAAAAALIVVIIAMRDSGMRNPLHYLPVALLFWFAVLESGVHATIAGVILGLLAPTTSSIRKQAFLDAVQPLITDMKRAQAAGDEESADAALGEMEELTRETESMADRLVRTLHPWSSYLILPLFALANAGLPFTMEMLRHALWSPATQGVLVALVAGKAIGIVLFAWLGMRLRIGVPMPNVRWSHIAGVGLLGGIGFTVSLFISDLAFSETSLVAQAKLGIFVASLLAGILGVLLLRSKCGNTVQNPAVPVVSPRN